MKIYRLFSLLLAVLLLLGTLPLSASAQTGEPDRSVTSGCHSPDAAVALSDSGKLAETAKAVILYERNSDTLLYAWNPDTQIYPSSMVKLMTALVALEQGDLKEKVTVTKRALSYVEIGSVSAGLQAGEELTLEDLLYCMMVASANDASTVIAEHIGGTQEGFLAMMNRRAAELGCTGTQFTNVHGLHDEGTYTTARDICRIVDAALENEVFRAMFTTVSYTVPKTNKSEPRQVWTTNYMLSKENKENVKKYYDERVTGGKTGATDEAGRCLVATAEGGGMELLSIVMGAEPEYEEDGLALKRFGSFEETKALLDYALENYQYRQVFFHGQAVSQFPVENGANAVVACPAASASTVLPVDITQDKLTWIYGDATGHVVAPVEKGQALSTAQVWYGSKCLAQTDLVAMNGVPEWSAPVIPPMPEGSAGAIWKWVLIILSVLLGLGVLGGFVVFLRRMILRAKQKARRRRRRSGRQRSR